MELLSIGEAAKKLGVHPNRLRAWEKQGLIKPVRLPSGPRRYPTCPGFAGCSDFLFSPAVWCEGWQENPAGFSGADKGCRRNTRRTNLA
ncbi:MerR family DNA-binding transcriptional regulator [Fervidicola ferrireducens]|uniref:MerR family DNA-binding transcriptional regulator n=1 Tax=Fervidicola ferrireducens TaxID=520764 RepID=UPI001CA3D397